MNVKDFLDLEDSVLAERAYTEGYRRGRENHLTRRQMERLRDYNLSVKENRDFIPYNRLQKWNCFYDSFTGGYRAGTGGYSSIYEKRNNNDPQSMTLGEKIFCGIIVGGLVLLCLGVANDSKQK